MAKQASLQSQEREVACLRLVAVPIRSPFPSLQEADEKFVLFPEPQSTKSLKQED